MQPTVPVSSVKKWTLAKSDINEKRVAAITTWSRVQVGQVDPVVINTVYTDAFTATNDFLWKCKPDEYYAVRAARFRVCQFMSQDVALSESFKELNSIFITQKRRYPTRRDRWLKFKHDVHKWILCRVEVLMFRD